MTVRSIFYCVLGALLVVLGASCLAEKYRTVRGGRRVPARILRCEKAAEGKRSGGWRYVVEFEADGLVLDRPTNDSFWFDHQSRVGALVTVWYNPARPRVVERCGPEAELLAAVMILLGLAAFFLLGLS